MRRTRIAAATVMLAVGLMGAVAAPASAAKPSNYGGCVRDNPGSPSQSTTGPANQQGVDASGERGGSVFTGIDHSGGTPRFTGVGGCL